MIETFSSPAAAQEWANQNLEPDTYYIYNIKPEELADYPKQTVFLCDYDGKKHLHNFEEYDTEELAQRVDVETDEEKQADRRGIITIYKGSSYKLHEPNFPLTAEEKDTLNHAIVSFSFLLSETGAMKATDTTTTAGYFAGLIGDRYCLENPKIRSIVDLLQKIEDGADLARGMDHWLKGEQTSGADCSYHQAQAAAYFQRYHSAENEPPQGAQLDFFKSVQLKLI